MRKIRIALTVEVVALAVLLALIVVGCTVPQYSTNPDGSTNVVQTVDPRLTTAIETSKAVNAATVPVNPYAPFIDWGLGVLAAGAALVAKYKNDQNAQHALLLKTVVQGVENAGNAEVKAAIKSQATAIGVEGDLSTKVQAINSGLI